MNGTIVDPQNQQSITQQRKRLSWRTKITLVISTLLLLGILLLTVNVCLVFGAAGLDLALMIIGGTIIGTALLVLAATIWLISSLIHTCATLSLKVAGSSYSPWLTILLRGILSSVIWNVWQWTSTAPNAPSSGWRPHTGT